jgi:hypothetical protein
MPPHTYFQVPQFLLDDWLYNWDFSERKHIQIICTRPRQLSAIGVAERVAEERAEEIGETVGYQVTHSVLYNTLHLRGLNALEYSLYKIKLTPEL